MTPRKRNKKTAFDRLVGYLAARDHSEFELKKKLRAHHTEEEIAQALERADEYGYLKAPEEIAQKVASALRRRGKGQAYILGYLKSRKLPAVANDSTLFAEEAAELIRRKLKFEYPYSPEQKKKIFSFLKNRGYNLETIRAATQNKA